MMRSLLLLPLLTAGCSALYPGDDDGQQGQACAEQVEADEETARLGWRNARSNRTTPTPPAPFSHAALTDLRNGLTRDELHGLAGLPLRRSAADTAEVWSYAVDDLTVLDVALVGGVVSRWWYARR